jgi:hypothetical protein
MRSTLRRTSSLASAGNRSTFESAARTLYEYVLAVDIAVFA